jgi:thiol-disulfide isomerase/thioredoxin
MKKIMLFIFICSHFFSAAQSQAEKPAILYGACTIDSLQAEPYTKWFTAGYDAYNPNAGTLTQLKKINTGDISIEIFFGTWCGDSKRELPRFIKLLHELSFSAKKIKLIALGGGDSLVKQSPQHEEAGKGIFRVPTFILYKNGTELGRINEFPVYSLEKDLLALFSNQPYTPNYASFGLVKKWLADSTLLDDNTSTAGLAGLIRLAVKNEHELNSLGYLLLKQGRKKEALRIFQINYSLYPESSNVASSLGEGYLETGDYKKAVLLLERSIDLNKNGADNKETLGLIYKAKEKEKG